MPEVALANLLDKFVIEPDKGKIKEYSNPDELATFIDLYAEPIDNCVIDGGVPTVVECNVIDYIIPLLLVLLYSKNRSLLVIECNMRSKDLDKAFRILRKCEKHLRNDGLDGFNKWWNINHDRNIRRLSRLSRLKFEIVE